MDSAGNSQNGKFTHMMKRIWNGPEEEEPQMKPERSNNPDYNYQNYSQRPDPYGQGKTENARPAPQPEYRDERNYEQKGFNGGSADSTVISKGTTIVGDIKSDSDIEMYGAMTGSINTSGNIKLNGKQDGDVQGSGINLSSCTVRGSLNAAEDITVDSDSVIVGDIKCGNLTFDGKLKGNIHVMGNVKCQNSAIVIGDITSTTITVDSGAKLQGKVQISDGSIEQVDLPDDFAAPKPQK